MNDVVITLDIDWAPDFIIDAVADQLVYHSVRATWFVTHASPAIERLRTQSDLFELGIHPNFLSGSTHGDSPDLVLQHCLDLVPEATSVRSHALVQSTPLLGQIMHQTGVTTDVSLFLPHAPSLCPVEYWWQGKRLVRIPYYWEDDLEMEFPSPCWHLEPLLNTGTGLKVFDFHPIHIYLNSTNMQPYTTLKTTVPRLSEASPEDVSPFVQKGQGTRGLFTELVAYLANTEKKLRICDVYKHYAHIHR